MADRAGRLNAWVADHFLVAAVIFVAWTALAFAHLLVPHHLVTSDGHLIDASTVQRGGYNVWAYRNLAYSDIYRLYAERGLFGHPLPYLHTAIEYPVVTGLFIWAASLAPGVQAYFLVSAIGLLVAGLLALRLLRDLIPESYHFFALTPLLLVYSLLNWELLGIFLLVLGWWFVRRDRWAAGGGAFALGTFAKLFPAIAVPFLAAELVRRRQPRKLAGAAVAFVVTSLVVNLPFALLGWHNWTFFIRFNTTRSVSGLLSLTSNVAVADGLEALVVLGAIAVGVRAVLRGGSPERAAAFAFAAFLLVNKVYSPQYLLWLLVMALIAGWPGWTMLLLSIAGLVDYFGTFGGLYLTNASTAQSVSSRRIADLLDVVVPLFRYGGIALSTLGTALRSRLRPVTAAGEGKLEAA